MKKPSRGREGFDQKWLLESAHSSLHAHVRAPAARASVGTCRCGECGAHGTALGCTTARPGFGSIRAVSEAAFDHWLAALEKRHYAELTFPEVRKGLQALSTI